MTINISSSPTITRVAMTRSPTHPAQPETHRTPKDWAFLAFGTLLLFGLCAKLRLWWALKQKAIPLFSFDSQGSLAFFGSIWHDLVLATWMACLVWIAASLQHHLRERALPHVVHIGLWCIVHIVLLAISLAAGGHHRVLFEMNSGLTYDLVREANTALSATAFMAFLSVGDAFFLLLPIGLFWGLYKLPSPLRIARDRSIALLAIGIVCLELFLALGNTAVLHPAISSVPIRFLAKDFVKHHTPQLDADEPLGEPDRTSTPQAKKPATRRPPTKRSKYRKSPYPTPRNQSESMRLLAPYFSHKGFPVKDLLPPQHKDQKTKWNVIVMVLESLGTRYMFDTSRGNRVPMPFMQKILKQGWYFKNHVSTANSSPRSLFSIFTGLYPIPQFDMFVMRKDVKTPTLSGYLPKEYDQFLVTPAGLFWYFPKQFFLNNGPKQLVGARSKPLKRIKKYGSFPNEIDVTTYFIKRITQAKEPFFATYVSFIPHGPYDDYGPKYRLLPNVKKNFHRYINNLNVLDLQIARIFKALETSKRKERTIVVMVGDHGQAFWQHRYNYGHSRMSYQENYEAPLFFYQPKLFKPRRDRRLSSHVDIVPTLLDALRIPYNPNLLQGESLFQSRFARKQIFLFGNEQTLSSIQPEGPKMQYSLKRRRCWVYDLKTDPKEKKRLRCKGYPDQRRALRRFLKRQKRLIFDYNRASRDGKAFFGQTHPTLKTGSQAP